MSDDNNQHDTAAMEAYRRRLEQTVAREQIPYDLRSPAPPALGAKEDFEDHDDSGPAASPG